MSDESCPLRDKALVALALKFFDKEIPGNPGVPEPALAIAGIGIEIICSYCLKNRLRFARSTLYVQIKELEGETKPGQRQLPR